MQGAVWLIALTAAAAQPAANDQPTLGQDGKDVMWIPTADALIGQMLDMAQVTPTDHVIDLGSGDGRVVIAAAKRGAKALGIEYEQGLVDLSVRNAAAAGVSDKATFVKADLFETDLSQATVLTMFLLPELNLRLRSRILALKPGTRVVSNSFDMGDWKADQTTEAAAADCTQYCRAYFWIVPASVEGSWQLEGGELSLQQTYQQVSGTIRIGSVVHPIRDGQIRGEDISFSAADQTFFGRVSGTVIEGTRRSGVFNLAWRATRG